MQRKTTLNIVQAKYAAQAKLHILMPKEQRRDFREIPKTSSGFKMKGTKSHDTLRTLHTKYMQLFNRIHPAFDFTHEIVHNIIAYAKCLPKPGANSIDRNIFEAQMKRHFHITDMMMLTRMFDVCTFGERYCRLAVYVELMAIFLSNIQDLKVQLVFRLYNSHEDGFITKKDLEYFIKPMVEKVSSLEESSEESSVNDFVGMLLHVVDLNNDEKVDLNEFRHLAQRNVLMMECLGPCLPGEQERLQFLRHLSNKTPTECSALFRFERKIALQSAPEVFRAEGIQKYFPVPLDLP